MIEIILIGSIFILIVVAVVEGIIIRRKMAQSNKYQNVLELYENWIENFVLTVETVDGELDRLDAAGTFRADDEIGFFFQSIYSILKKLSEYGLTNNPDETFQAGRGENTDFDRIRDRNRLPVDMSELKKHLMEKDTNTIT